MKDWFGGGLRPLVHCGAFRFAVASGLFAAAACGPAASSDPRFSAETFDEDSRPLTNAIIGTPKGVITIDGKGASSSSASSSSASSSAVRVGSSSGSTSSAGFSTSTGVTIGSSTGIGIGTATGIGVSTSSGIGIGTSSGTGIGTSTGDAGPADAGAGGGFGFWHFDDCSPTSHFLADSSGEGANAQQALGADCVPGVSGLGVDILSAKSVIQVPDEPQFTVGSRVAVAAWVHPNKVTGDHPIVLKRLNNQTSFSLGIHDGNVQMSVVLTTGTTVISQAPISPGVWTHVAGMFDGTFVYLFIDGQQFGQVYGAGTLRDVFAPIRIGATTQSQYFDGIIDEVFVSTEPETASQLEALACISNPSTLSVTPAVGAPVPFDTPSLFTATIADNDIGFCGARSYNAFAFSPDVGISATFDTTQFVSLTPGQTAPLGIDVTGSEEANPGAHLVEVDVNDFGNQGFENLSASATFNLAAPTGCFVFTNREILITDPSVVDDPVRTFGSTTGLGFTGGGPPPPNPIDGGIVIATSGSSRASGSSSTASSSPFVPAVEDASVDATAFADASAADATPGDGGASPDLGVWTFGHLLRDLAPTPDQAPALALQLFQHWLTDQTVNGFTVQARPAIQQTLLDEWPKTATGELDLDQAPLSLQAIVSRIDLRNLSAGSAGEGRFVFAVNNGSPLQFTVILEYNLPAQTPADVFHWASRWHALSSHPFPSEEYNAALESLTQSFTQRGASPGSINGSALLSLRTNEIALSFQWELREFELSPITGFFDENPLKETPDLSFNGTQTFADFVNENAAAIKAVIPGGSAGLVTPTFEGQAFQAGSVFNPLVEWSGPGIADPDARFHASENTCNGCHGPETGTTFLMISPTFPGPATLSPFLTGTTVFDPFSGQQRTLNDLARRQADLTSIACGDGGVPPPVPQGNQQAVP
jgi:hypothetical protein